MSAFQPKVISRSDPYRIEVEWADGHHTSYATADLRRLCPCAHCVSETTGVRLLDPASVPDFLTHLDVRMVGNYAISIRFSDGHETGIYPFRMLRENDPAL
jgi:DUF971 family protein